MTFSGWRSTQIGIHYALGNVSASYTRKEMQLVGPYMENQKILHHCKSIALRPPVHSQCSGTSLGLVTHLPFVEALDDLFVGPALSLIFVHKLTSHMNAMSTAQRMLKAQSEGSTPHTSASLYTTSQSRAEIF